MIRCCHRSFLLEPLSLSCHADSTQGRLNVSHSERDFSVANNLKLDLSSWTDAGTFHLPLHQLVNPFPDVCLCLHMAQRRTISLCAGHSQQGEQQAEGQPRRHCMRGDGVDSALISCEYKCMFTLASPLADCASLSCWFVNPPSDPTLDPNLIQHLGSLRSDLLPARGIAARS